MSNVIRPSGPLPPRVYWTRRVGLLIAVAVIISLVWWMFSKVGGAAGEPAATSRTVTPTTSAPSTSAEPSAEATVHKPRQGKPKEAEPSRAPRTRPAEPTGACDPADVDMEIEVSDASAGESNRADLLLTTIATPACMLAITPSSLVLRVTSGSEVVWSSDDCPDSLRAKQVVVRQDPATTYRFTWNGRRSTETCREVGTVPQPGGYWVESALIGGEPHRAFFDVT